MNLEELRKRIDDIDCQIIDLLNNRVKLAGQIGRAKHAEGSEVYVPSREEEIFKRLSSLSRGPLDDKSIRAIYRQVISATIALEKSLVIAYFGPEATFTHQAALKNFGESVEYCPMGTIPDVFAAVERGEADYGVIPIENSTGGAVDHSLDMLAETELKIVAENYLQISMCLIADSPLEEIKEVHSREIALAQCRNWLGRMLPHAKMVDCGSTAKAVKTAKVTKGVAAVAGSIAAELYDVPILHQNIQDKADNTTRFLVIGKASSTGTPLGHGRDKSSFVFSINDEVGALLRLLTPFSSRGLNLCKIESRPSRQKAWDYYFFVDILGHYADPLVQEAMEDLKKSCPVVKWLGSYPSASNC